MRGLCFEGFDEYIELPPRSAANNFAAGIFFLAWPLPVRMSRALQPNRSSRVKAKPVSMAQKAISRHAGHF
jgi:hypothetical protein